MPLRSDETLEDKDEGDGSPYLLFLALLLIIAATGYGAWRYAPLILRVAKADELAAIASGVAALFAGVGAAAVIVTLTLQRRELRLQRKELTLSRGEMAATRDEFRQQNDTIGWQRFEASFFNLWQAHRQIVSEQSASFSGPRSEVFRGQECFRIAAAELLRNFSIVVLPEPTGERMQQWAESLLESVCHQPSREFGHYFRSFYHLVKFLGDSTEIDSRRRWRYVQLVRSQLTNSEMTVLFFYGLTSDGSGMRKLASRYHLFRGLRLTHSTEKFKELYASSAFGATTRTTLPESDELAV